MPKLCNLDIEHSQKIYKRLNKFIQKLKEKFTIKDLYLYGSFAKGEVHEGSDIDLLIIGDFSERFFDRIGKVLDLTDLPIEPLVYTVEEFKELKNSQNPFIIEILKTAIRLA